MQGFRQGQRQFEPAAARRCNVQGQLTAVQPRNIPGDREPEAATLWGQIGPPLEATENALMVPRSNARAVVFDDNDTDRLPDDHAKVYLSPTGHIADRVVNQVVDGGPQQRFIRHDPDGFLGIDAKLDALFNRMGCMVRSPTAQ